MANFMFVKYNPENGKYLGHTYASNISENDIELGTSVRKLDSEEMNLVGLEYQEFIYNQSQLIKLPELAFVVSPNPVYAIGLHNKISITLKRSVDTTNSEYEQLKGNDYKILINGQEIMLKFEETLFLNPTQSGIYLFELADDRVFAKTSSYTVSILEPTPQ